MTTTLTITLRVSIHFINFVSIQNHTNYWNDLYWNGFYQSSFLISDVYEKRWRQKSFISSFLSCRLSFLLFLNKCILLLNSFVYIFLDLVSIYIYRSIRSKKVSEYCNKVGIWFVIIEHNSWSCLMIRESRLHIVFFFSFVNSTSWKLSTPNIF